MLGFSRVPERPLSGTAHIQADWTPAWGREEDIELSLQSGPLETRSGQPDFMKHALSVLGWILVIAGGAAVAAGVVYSFWVLWSLGPMALLNILPVVLVFSGMSCSAIGLGLISWVKSRN